jgi:four helix bundle protein
MNQPIRSFKDLMVWQKAHQLFLQLAQDVESFPRTRAAVIITHQLLRAVGSISANIAEGFGRRSGAEYVHYLIVARGSTTENENWLIKCKELHYLSEQVWKEKRDKISSAGLRWLRSTAVSLDDGCCPLTLSLLSLLAILPLCQ